VSGNVATTSAAQRTASTMLANSASSPSPVFLTTRPWCSFELRINQLLEVHFEAFVGAFLVSSHQARE
jgi:hypothetical protein